MKVGHNNSTSGVKGEGKPDKMHLDFENVSVDFDLLELLGLELAEGRFFSENFGSEDSTIILMKPP